MILPRVLILAGGLGTRLSAVIKDVPKPMAPIAGRPFLEYQIEFLKRQGFREFTLLIGHLSHIIQEHFGTGEKFGVHIEYSVEHEPLGTGGAIRQAMESSTAQSFLVLNGDSLFTADYLRFLKFAKPPVSLALKYTSDLSRFGSVKIDSNYTVTGFFEKSDASKDGYINAGAYYLTRDALKLMPQGKFSFETQVLTPLSKGENVLGIPCGGLFVDIGTPESFAWSQDHLPDWLKQTPKPCLFVDRDGILVEHKHYLHKIDEAVMIPTTTEILKCAKENGWWIVVVTNQSGVGRGVFTLQDCELLNAHIDAELTKGGGKPDVWECSYDHPTEALGEYKRDSLRRKPKPGMLLEACEKLPIDLSRSLMIGDNSTDQIELPGLRTILVQGDFELKNIKSGNRVTKNFKELNQTACALINKISAGVPD